MAVGATVVQDVGGPSQLPLIFNRVWLVTATVDPASVATQANGSDNIIVPGLLLGDIVLAKSFAVAGSEAGLTVTAYVSATNTITVLYGNNTAGAIDVVSGVVKLVVARAAF